VIPRRSTGEMATEAIHFSRTKLALGAATLLATATPAALVVLGDTKPAEAAHGGVGAAEDAGAGGRGVITRFGKK
jgi:hypothetical protein